MQVVGSDFPADEPVTLTVDTPSGQIVLTQATNPALRTDIRGRVLFQLDPTRDDVGTATIAAAAGGCTASSSHEVLEAMFPPRCPVTEPVASGGAGSTAYEARIRADDPIAYWRFEEDEGPIAEAAVGRAAAIQGNPALGQAGPIPGSRAIGLDGDGDWVDVPDLELAGDFTIEGWVWFCENDISGDDALAGNPDGSPPNLNFFEGRFRLWAGDDDVAISDQPLELGRWYHVAATRRGEVVTLYVDAAAVGSGTYASPLPVAAIGSGGGTLAGQLDEVAIYDHALTIVQLADRVAARG